ncbi:MAG: radical SAM protein [Candidatus Omnitrophota bacterium]|nr:radical SAM protein [Candidatus Omnitrophota bacterium]MDZ4243074.1 radical SAM protein [Candidatus Omnitrophota bacterium]
MPTGTEPVHHIQRPDWLRTSKNDPRGYIQPESLKELWFHTGTICNLSCPFCLEGSKPGDDRLNRIAFEDARPFMDEAVRLGVEKFSFTGGEPFVVKDFVRILDYALDLRPCLVLTNGTDPLRTRLSEIVPFLQKPHPLNFRVSIDYPDEARHDAGRGKGNFAQAAASLKELYIAGFGVSIARQRLPGENVKEGDAAYQPLIQKAGLPEETRIVSFPDFFLPQANVRTPEITENCMTAYQAEEARRKFMCSYSKMVVKREGQMRVYACTLVDDDPDYDLGRTLTGSMKVRVMLKHHRCYSCFSQGASCSEM